MENSERLKQIYLQLKKYNALTIISDIKLPDNVLIKKQNDNVFLKQENKEYICKFMAKNIYSYSGVYNDDYTEFKSIPIENVCTLKEIKQITVFIACTSFRKGSTLILNPDVIFNKLKELYPNHIINLFMANPLDEVSDENKKKK